MRERPKNSRNPVGMVAHAYNPRAQEAEAGGSQVRYQSGLHSETMSRNKTNSRKCLRTPCLPFPHTTKNGMTDRSRTMGQHLTFPPWLIWCKDFLQEP